MYQYKTQGTCSSSITFDIEDGKIRNVAFQNGCNGNLKAMSILVEGMDAGECIEKLKGVHCGSRPTSCGDQLAKAIELAVNQNGQ